jgi:hypothetical protein
LKKAQDEDIPTTGRYPPDDPKKWLTEEDFKKRDQRWKNGNIKMKERKKDTKGMPRNKKLTKSRFRLGYTGATHGPNMEWVSNQLCPFCNT